jgi:hypothetical protein
MVASMLEVTPASRAWWRALTVSIGVGSRDAAGERNRRVFASIQFFDEDDDYLMEVIQLD